MEVSNPKQCIYITTCKDRHMCDGEGVVYHHREIQGDCNKYVSREERYLASLIERDETWIKKSLN